MYDEFSLKELIENNGLKEVKRRKHSESLVPSIELVETPERHKMAICLEGYK